MREPVIKNLGGSIYGYEAIVSSLSGLLAAASPLAIILKISKVVIFPMKRKVRLKSTPHINQEILKFIPPITNRYAPFKICLTVRIFRPASILHGKPSFVNRVLARAKGKSMSAVNHWKFLILETAATLYISHQEIIGRGFFNLSTVALATPFSPSALISAELNNKQSAKPLSGMIFNFPDWYRLCHASHGIV